METISVRIIRSNQKSITIFKERREDHSELMKMADTIITSLNEVGITNGTYRVVGGVTIWKFMYKDCEIRISIYSIKNNNSGYRKDIARIIKNIVDNNVL